VNTTICAHLVEFYISRLKLADEKWPAYAEDLGGLLRRLLSMHRNERHGITCGHLDQEVDEHTDGLSRNSYWLGKPL